MAEADAATRAYLAIDRRDRRRRHRPQHLAEADAARARRRSRDLRRQPAPHPRRAPPRTTSSSASTWRTRRYTAGHARHLRDACGSRATATSAWCCSRACRGARDDAARMNALGARVRLVKGAYKEPKRVAYQAKADVDAAFVEHHAAAARARAPIPAIATHDPAMIAATRAFARERGIAPDRYEFQMLYGIRRDLQATLVARGLPRPRLRPVRPRMVPLLHAPARRTPGQRRFRACGSLVASGNSPAARRSSTSSG